MKLLLATVALLLLGALAWSIGSVLSSDALGMIIGLLFGILVPLPGIFLILVAARRNAPTHDPYYTPRPAPQPPAALLPPPTVIIVQLPSGQRVRAQVIDGQRRLED